MPDLENHETTGFVRGAGRAAIVGGALGLVAMVAVFVIEARAGGMGSISSVGAAAAGWTSFVAVSLLVVGLLGVAARYASVLSVAGRTALGVLGFATAVTVGTTATLALIVPTLLDRMPELVNDPPAAVPASFILSGLVSGIATLVLAVSLRRSGQRSMGTNLLFAGAVFTMVPLPSRFFMLAIAVGVLLLAPGGVRSQPRPVADAVPGGGFVARR